MCLNVDFMRHDEMNGRYNRSGRALPLVAEKDIMAWKILERNDRALYRNFAYEPKKKYSVARMGIQSSSGRAGASTIVERGFHAYTSRSIARDEFTPWRHGEWKIVKITIPKGAKYLLGINGDIVANIIITSDLKHCR